MFLFIIGLLWLFTWWVLIYTLDISYVNGSCTNWSQAERQRPSKYNRPSPHRPSPSLSTEFTALPIGAEPIGAGRSEFYAACSGTGTLRTFETSDELLHFIAGKSLSSWAVFKRRYARWWAVWRQVELGGHMSSSEIQGAIWET